MRLNVLSSAIITALALGGQAQAADFGLAKANTDGVKWDNWSCKRCTPASGLTGYASVGLGVASVDDIHSANASGVEDDGLVGVVDADLTHWADDGFVTRFQAQDLGLEFGRVTLTGSRAQDLEAKLDFRQWAHYDVTVLSPFSSANNNFTLPTDWVEGATTAQMTALNESLNPVELALKRDRVSLALDKHFNNVRSYAELTHQERDGNKRSGATILNNSVNLAEQLDDKTTEFATGLNFSGNNWQMALGYLGSHYRNNIDALRWENPYLPTFGAALAGQQAVHPDNDAHQIHLQGTWATGIHVFSSQLVWGRHEQNATLLPATINGPSPELPVSNADIELDKWDFNLRYRARLMSDLVLQAQLDYQERDYSDTNVLFPQIITDSLVVDSETPLSLDQEKRSASLSVDYRFVRGVRGELGYQSTEREWQNQAGDETSEDHYWGKLRLKRWQPLSVWFELGAQERRLDNYIGSVNATGVNNPALRQYYLADRDRYYGKLVSRYQFSTPLSAQLTLEASEEDYDDTLVGLTEVERTGYDLHINWYRDALSVYAFWNAYQLDTRQNGSPFSGVWSGLQQDDATTLGLGAELAEVFDENFSMGFDIVWSDSDGDTQVSQGISGNYGDYDATRTKVDLYGRYQLSATSSVQLNVLYQRYDDEDYLNRGLTPSSISNLLSFGDLSRSYNDYLLTVSYRHDF